MTKRWKLTFVLLSLTCVSVIFHRPLINWAISNEYLSTNNIHFLAEFDKVEFHHIQYQNNNVGTNQWLISSRFLAKSDSTIALLLANYYFSMNQIDYAILWYKQALKLGNSNAAQPLAQYWYETGKWTQSLSLAKRYSEHFWAQRLIVNISMAQGKLSEIDDLADMLEQSQQGKLLLAQLIKYQVIEQQQLKDSPNGFLNTSYNNIKEQSTCLSMQFFATTLNDLIHTSALINQIKNTEVGQYFCFATPQYISHKTLACHYLVDQAIGCNEAIWENTSTQLDARYLGVVLPEGGANVHSGILYLDSNDDVKVFRHELLHLLGFIDEYPLPINHPFCQTNEKQPSSHNIVVLERSYQGERERIRRQVLKKIAWADLIKPTTPILEQAASGWKVGTPQAFKDEIGLFPVSTCQNSELNSFKPLTAQSSLTYFELPLPQQYKDFLLTNSRKYLMPSFHYNVASALEKKGDKVNAQTWIKKAKQFNH